MWGAPGKLGPAQHEQQISRTNVCCSPGVWRRWKSRTCSSPCWCSWTPPALARSPTASRKSNSTHQDQGKPRKGEARQGERGQSIEEHADEKRSVHVTALYGHASLGDKPNVTGRAMKIYMFRALCARGGMISREIEKTQNLRKEYTNAIHTTAGGSVTSQRET